MISASAAHQVGGRPQARRGHRARVPPVQDRPVHRGPRDRRRPGRLVHRQVLRVLRVARRGAERHRRGPRQFASHQRMAEDWQLQLSTARSDLAQIAHQTQAATAAAGRRRARPRHPRAADRAQRVRRDVPDGQVRQRRALPVDVRAAVRGSTCRPTTWPTTWPGRPSAPSSSSGASTRRTRSFIQPAYWESRRNGLLAGETLGLDLERMAKAYLDADSRGLEITKRDLARRAGPGGAAAAEGGGHVRVRADRGAVRLRLPRPLPPPDPVGLGRLRRRRRRADHPERDR